MNIPLPGILTKESLPIVANYISVPEYGQPIILKGVPGLREPKIMVTEGARGMGRSRFAPAEMAIMGGYDPTGGERSLYGQVFTLEISNSNSNSAMAEIMPDNWDAANFGNVAGITITNQSNRDTYAQTLIALRNQPIRIGILRARIISGDPHLFRDFQILVTRTDVNGASATRAHNFRISPFQQQIDIVELTLRGDMLGTGSKISFALPANTTIAFDIYPEAGPLPARHAAGFAVLDDSGFTPREPLTDDDLSGDDFDQIPSAGRSLIQRMAARNAERKEMKDARRLAKQEAREARRDAKKTTFRFKEREFKQQALSEFSFAELNKIDELKNTDWVKYIHLVENYNFQSIVNNLASFL